MGIRKSAAKNKKSRRPATAIAVKREETTRKVARAGGRSRRRAP